MKLLDRLVALYAPHRCLSCKNDDSLLCRPCSIAELVEKPEVCYLCNKLSDNFATCSACLRKTKLKSVFVAYDYDSCAKELIRQLKFQRAFASAKTAAELMAESLPARNYDVITHVPTAPKRVRQRGYDQAKLIAREIANTLNTPHRTLLARINNTRQVGRSTKVRKQQIDGAFVAKGVSNVRSVLVIDDVMASGSTLESAAKTLSGAGIKKVHGAVFARS